jgi:hypothetical protein
LEYILDEGSCNSNWISLSIDKLSNDHARKLSDFGGWGTKHGEYPREFFENACYLEFPFIGRNGLSNIAFKALTKFHGELKIGRGQPGGFEMTQKQMRYAMESECYSIDLNLHSISDECADAFHPKENISLNLYKKPSAQILKKWGSRCFIDFS